MLHRRQLLQYGGSSALGLSLPFVLSERGQAAAVMPRVKSVVVIFLTGGAPHIDMFDPKPDGGEAKGEYDPISTRVSGLHFSEMLPLLASRADQLAIVRSMSHGDNRHLSGTHNALTGSIQPFRGNSNQDKSLNRADWPCYGAAVDYLRRRSDGLPSQVTLPNPLIEGVLVWPAQHSGFLGPAYDPFQINNDPNAETFEVSNLKLLEGLNQQRVDQRRRLLDRLAHRESELADSSDGQGYQAKQELAYSMLTSARLAKAFRIDSEPEDVRERYGRHKYGQSLLLARRLVEAEVPVIQCNMGHVQMWDTHVDHFPRLKTMLPRLDQGVSALLDDLTQRSLLDETLLVMVGEFGRTPTISSLANQKVPGRHHWASAYSAVFAGGGVRGGQVIGQTDRTGGYPLSSPYHPNDMGATIYTALGIDPHVTIPDRLGRPIPLNQGTVMDVLYAG